jgi:hypothetical protein
MRRSYARFAALGATLLAVLAAQANPALAHEGRKVGKYEFLVGFGDEPAYAGGKNSVALFLSTAADHKPVTELGDSLKVTVEKDGQSLPLEIEPNFEVGEFGTPGDYRAWFFPTRPGKYTFHFTGSIGGQHVDESFTSSPTGFSEVETSAEKEFPAKDPSTADLGQRLDRELPRLTSAQAVQDKRVTDVDSTARQALAAGIAGTALGFLGVLLALLSWLSWRRRA